MRDGGKDVHAEFGDEVLEGSSIRSRDLVELG
jgi:hypothetical protein